MADQPYAPERRPLASRELGVWKRLAAWLAARNVSPNAISTAGMVAGVAAAAAFAAARLDGWHHVGFLAAAALIQLRLLANMLDGMVAVQSKKASPVGEMFNEVPDRVSDAAILIGAGYAPGAAPVLGYVAACLALFVAYIRAEGKVAGAHQEFCGPMAKPQRMFVLTIAALWCGLTPVALQPTLPGPAFAYASGLDGGGALGVTGAVLLLIVVGCLITAVRRLVRIARALRRPPP